MLGIKQRVRDDQVRQQQQLLWRMQEAGSVSIPPGHRQTIRRYFEIVHPSAEETDAVNAQTDTKPDGN